MQSTCKDRLSNTISPSLVPARLAVGFGPKELSPSPSSASWRFTRGPSERSNVGPHPRRAAGDSVFLGILLSPGGIRTRWVVVNVLDHLIHPSAWNRNSANFAFWVFCEVRIHGVLGSSLSSNAAQRRLRVRYETLVDGVGDTPLEAPQRLLAGLALRQLLAVVGAASSVRPGLAYGDHVQGVVEVAVSSQREPVAHH